MNLNRLRSLKNRNGVWIDVELWDRKIRTRQPVMRGITGPLGMGQPRRSGEALTGKECARGKQGTKNEAAEEASFRASVHWRTERIANSQREGKRVLQWDCYPPLVDAEWGL